MATPEDMGAPPAPAGTESSESSIKLGSESVIAVKIAAAGVGVGVIIWYLIFLAYTDSPYTLLGLSYWLWGIIFGGIGLGIGIAGIFIGNLKISNRPNMPTLNIILIILSIIFIFIMPIFGSWKDPRTIGSGLWNLPNLLNVLVFAVLALCYIELAHATARFSEIDNYATEHNLKEFNVSSVITNYFLWFAILMAVIVVISMIVLLLQLALSPVIKDTAPQFGHSLEYNSIYSILISIALVFVPIGIILAFVFGHFFKSRRAIVVKSKQDVVARRPDEVTVK